MRNFKTHRKKHVKKPKSKCHIENGKIFWEYILKMEDIFEEMGDTFLRRNFAIRINLATL